MVFVWSLAIMAKRYRVTFDFAVDTRDITRESVNEDLQHYSNVSELMNDPGVWEMAQIQRRLLHAVLKDEEFVQKRLRSLVAFELGYLSERDMNELLGTEVDGLDFEHLQPFIAQLSESDQDFFQGAHDAGAFSESTEHVRSSFLVEILASKIVEAEE